MKLKKMKDFKVRKIRKDKNYFWDYEIPYNCAVFKKTIFFDADETFTLEVFDKSISEELRPPMNKTLDYYFKNQNYEECKKYFERWRCKKLDQLPFKKLISMQKQIYNFFIQNKYYKYIVVDLR